MTMPNSILEVSLTTPSNLDLGDTYGALFIGLILAALLFGITNLQVFMYYQSYTEDNIFNKLAVAWLWFLNAFHLALCCHAVYFYLIINYANPIELTFVVWSFTLQLVIDTITIFTVHVLYSIRLWKLASIYDKNIFAAKIVPFVVTLLIVAEAGIFIFVSKCIYADMSQNFTNIDSLKWAIILIFVTVSVVDAIIAASMCFTLAKLRTGLSQSDSIINHLMMFVLNSGVLTSLCSLVTVSVYAAYPHTFIWLAVNLLLNQLYANSFLAMFNARNLLKAASNKTVILSGWNGSTPADRQGQPESTWQKAATGFDRAPGESGTLVFAHSFSESP